MAIVNLNTIKNWFKTGSKPSQAQFWDTWDSFRHKSEKIPAIDVEGIDALLFSKADKAVLDDHLINENAHAALFLAKEDKAKKGVAGGYAPLDEFAKLASQYLNIVNDLVSGGATSILSAEQGKVLQTQITGINTLLNSNDVNLDTVQELVDAIKAVQPSLNTILVNDLVSGGVTKALTAEMGKQLQQEKLTATLATDAEMQVYGVSSEDNKVVTRNKLFNWWAWVKSKATTISGVWDFTNTLNMKGASLLCSPPTGSYPFASAGYDAFYSYSDASNFMQWGYQKLAWYSNSFRTELFVTKPTQNNLIYLPNQGGTIALISDVTGKQEISNQIEVIASQNAQASWHGKTVFFMANVTITIPASGLPSGYTFEGVTEPSCSVSWAITAPKVWALGAPTATPEKSIFTLMQLMSNSNKIYLFGV
jgi:hypothetical protein